MHMHMYMLCVLLLSQEDHLNGLNMQRKHFSRFQITYEKERKQKKDKNKKIRKQERKTQMQTHTDNALSKNV